MLSEIQSVDGGLMPLATRVIPQLLCNGRQLIKGQKYDGWRSVGVVSQAVRIYQARGVDELMLLDIAATKEGRGPDLSLIEELANVCFMPLSVGGGIKTLQDIRDLLNSGADKVVIGRAALDRDFIQKAADKYGSQCIVVSVDYTEQEIPDKRCRLLEQSGAGEVLLNNRYREGTFCGYDLPAIEVCSQAVNIPVVASCGCSSYENMLEAINAGASAVSAGALFQFTDATPKGAADYLHEHQIEVRR